MGITASLIGAVAAVGGTALGASQANQSKKELDRQKSIAASNQRKQASLIADQEKLELAEQKSLDEQLAIKQRSESEAAQLRASSEETRKRQLRGRRSLVSGSGPLGEDEVLGG